LLGAFVLVFDQDLKFVLAAGEPLERPWDASAYPDGQFVGDAFPASLWKLIEPLCRSALQRRDRSREVWTAERGRGLMVDVGPLRLDSLPAPNGGLAAAMGGVAVVLESPLASGQATACRLIRTISSRYSSERRSGWGCSI
jgi:hypothetical protein